MKLADLRKLSIRQQLKIHVRLRNGMECVVSEHGIAQVPSFRGIPDFNLEEELESAAEFLLEPAAPPRKSDRAAAKPRSVSRAELAGMTASPAAGGAASEHEED